MSDCSLRAPRSMEFSRQEYWSRETSPSQGESPGIFPNPGIELRPPTLQADALPSEPPEKPMLSFDSMPTAFFVWGSPSQHSLHRPAPAALLFLHYKNEASVKYTKDNRSNYWATGLPDIHHVLYHIRLQWCRLLAFSCPVMSYSSRPHGLHHARPPCPSLSPRVCPNSHPLHWWYHSAISSSVVPFSSSL